MISGMTIKKQRQYLRITQKQLAQMLYITQQSVSKWETERAYPTYDLYLRAISLLGLDGENKVYDIHDMDNDTHFGIVGYGNNRKWAIKNKDKYIIKFLYGGHIAFWKPKTNEKGRVITQ